MGSGRGRVRVRVRVRVAADSDHGAGSSERWEDRRDRGREGAAVSDGTASGADARGCGEREGGILLHSLHARDGRRDRGVQRRHVADHEAGGADGEPAEILARQRAYGR